MGVWAKSLRIFKDLCAHGTQRVRRGARQTGVSKSSVPRLPQAMPRRAPPRSRGGGKRHKAGSGGPVWLGRRFIRSGSRAGEGLTPSASVSCGGLWRRRGGVPPPPDAG